MILRGMKVRDVLSGFEGTVVCRAEWLYGCVRITVQPPGLHEGKPIDWQTFDEPQLEILDAIGAVACIGSEHAQAQPAPTGGPSREGPRASDPW